MASYLALFVATLVGITVQASVGFGFAFFVAPVAVALFEPEEAITLLLLLGVAINSLVLVGERRQVQLEGRPLVVMLVAAIPGLVAGVAIIHQVSTSTLQIAVGVVILSAAALQMRRADIERRADSRHPHLVVAGASAGVLTTATSLNGPAVVLGLLSLGWRGPRLRDGIAAALLALSVMGTAAVVLIGGADRAFPPFWVVFTSVPLVIVGHRIGAALFRRLGESGHKQLVIVASAIAGLVSIAAGIL